MLEILMYYRVHSSFCTGDGSSQALLSLRENRTWLPACPPAAGARHPLATLFMGFLLLAISILAPVAAGAQAERIHINASDWEYDSREGVTRLLGDVHIRQGATEVWADNGLVRGTINQPERVELEGSPCRWKGTLEDGTPVEGNSSRIEFEIATNVLRFTGNVRFEGPQGTYTADVLTYDMNSGQISGRGEGAEGRVSFVIEPEAIQEASTDDSTDDD